MSLYSDLNDFVVTLGGGAPGWNDCALSEQQVNDLAAYIGPQFLPLAERWYSELKASGSNPYTAISDSKLGPLAMRDTLKAWSQGTTPDPTAKQINVLLKQKAAAEADIASGTPRQDTNLDAILAKLHALGWTEPPATAAAAPAPAEPSLLEATVLRIGRQVFGLDIKTLEELATKIGVIVPPVR